MRVNDANSYKVYRETTPEVENDLKATQQGFSVTAQSSETGSYTRENPGDEASWGYTAPADGERHGLGSYSQAIPAIMTPDGEIYPIKNKALEIDESYDYKEEGDEEEDTHEKVRIAQDTENGQVGIIVTCLNHESQEQIFFPINAGIRVDNVNTGENNRSTKIYDIAEGGEINAANIGATHDLLYVKDNTADIKTLANFYMNDSKNGPINFEESSYPTVTTPEKSKNYEVKFVFHDGKWKMYAIGEDFSYTPPSQTERTYEEVRIWRDVSPGELQ